jgi:magnesium-transporting ATPase (P-type)
MKKYSISKRYVSHIRYYYKLIKLYVLEIVISAIIIELVYIVNYYFMLVKFKENHPDKMSNVGKDVNFGDLEHLLWGSLYKHMSDYDYWEKKVALNQTFTTFYIGIIILTMSLGFEHERHSAYRRRYYITKNQPFMTVFIVELVILIVYFILFTTMSDIDDMYFPNYVFWIVLFFHCIIIMIADPFIKRIIETQYEKDQTRLSLFYEIKLGMYSPK